MSSVPNVIIYRYNGSPFATKVENILALRNIPYSQVDVPMVPPREALLALGIAYRKIPVVAIDGDVYINTPLIAQALERAFPPSEKHPSIFPGNDPTLQLLWSSSYADRELFMLGIPSIPWTKVPSKISQDRFGAMGGVAPPPPEYFKKLEAKYPETQSALATHLQRFEDHLSDGRQWLFSTDTPSYADVSAYMTLAWVRPLPTVSAVFDNKVFPKTVAWLDRLAAIISQRRNTTTIQKISADEAVKQILSTTARSVEPFDEIEGGRLSLRKGERVSVTPDDTGKVPTEGTLSSITRREIVIAVSPPSGGEVVVHFPRSGFVVRSTSKQSKL